MTNILLNEARSSRYLSLAPSTKAKYASRLVKEMPNAPYLQSIKDILTNSIVTFGVEDNPFFDFAKKIDFSIPKSASSLFDYLADNAHTLNLSADWFYNKSLYDRSLRDFIYTVNAFDIVSNKSKSQKYFKDNTDVDVKEFYLSDGSIKPAGDENTSGDTIWNTIESWSKDTETLADSKITIQDVMDMMKISKAEYGKKLAKWVDRYYDDVYPIPKQDKDDIKQVISMLFDFAIRTPEFNKLRNSLLTAREIPNTKSTNALMSAIISVCDSITTKIIYAGKSM